MGGGSGEYSRLETLLGHLLLGCTVRIQPFKISGGLRVVGVYGRGEGG